MKLAGQAQAEVVKVVAFGAVILVAVWAVRKGIGAAQETVSQTLADVADGVLSAPAATVQYVGTVVGIPRTDTPAAVDRCAAAKAARNIGDIGLHCPAADYFAALPDLPAALWNDFTSLFKS